VAALWECPTLLEPNDVGAADSTIPKCESRAFPLTMLARDVMMRSQSGGEQRARRPRAPSLKRNSRCRNDDSAEDASCKQSSTFLDRHFKVDSVISISVCYLHLESPVRHAKTTTLLAIRELGRKLSLMATAFRSCWSGMQLMRDRC
jgi:hypothetical protein